MATLPTSGRPIPPAPSRANISRRQPDGTIYVTVDGDGSQATAGTLRALFDRVRQHRPALAIADLTDVAVMDIGGVEALAAAARNLESASCRLPAQPTGAHPGGAGQHRTGHGGYGLRRDRHPPAAHDGELMTNVPSDALERARRAGALDL